MCLHGSLDYCIFVAQMRLALGADHAGYDLKQNLVHLLRGLGHDVADFGTNSAERADYPDFAHPVAAAVEQGQAELGVLVCGSGNGVCIAANRHVGVRAVLAWLPEVAALGRQHNDANVLCLPARYVDTDQAHQIVAAFLAASFEGGRHQARVEKI